MKFNLSQYIRFFYLIIGLFVFIYLGLSGYDYYSLTIEERVFHKNHSILKPSGTIGHGLGILGSLMMILGVSSYSIRKRWKKIKTLGYLKYWLEFHIFLCSVGPILILYHSAFKFGGIISIGFWSMVIVVFSGLIGRFLYVQIPRTLQGELLSLQEIEKQINILLEEISFSVKEKLINLILSERLYKKEIKDEKFLTMIKTLLNETLKQRKKIKEAKSIILSLPNLSIYQKREMLKKSKMLISLKKKYHIYFIIEKLFRYWHIYHLPFAITMFVLMIIHIIVAILFGSHWIF